MGKLKQWFSTIGTKLVKKILWPLEKIKTLKDTKLVKKMTFKKGDK